MSSNQVLISGGKIRAGISVRSQAHGDLQIENQHSQNQTVSDQNQRQNNLQTPIQYQNDSTNQMAQYIFQNPINLISLKGLSTKQSMIYVELFQQFCSDGMRISAIEFFKLCKLCKIYPVVITFEDLKKIVLKNQEFWHYHQLFPAPNQEGIDNLLVPKPSQDNSFPFNEFVNAFRIVGRIGYAQTGETDHKTFQLVTQYLQKQLKQLKIKDGNQQKQVSQNRAQQTIQYNSNQSNKINFQDQNRVDSQVQSKSPPKSLSQKPNQLQFSEYQQLSEQKVASDFINLNNKRYIEDADQIIMQNIQKNNFQSIQNQQLHQNFMTRQSQENQFNQNRQPKFFNKKVPTQIEEDRQSTKTIAYLDNSQNEMNTIVKGYQQSDVRSEYSGARGGGRKNFGQISAIKQPAIAQTIIQSNGMNSLRPNTIHRALVGNNPQISKSKGKRKSAVGNRKNNSNAANTSLNAKQDIRTTQAMNTYGTQDVKNVYSTQNSQQMKTINSKGYSQNSQAVNLSSISNQVTTSINSFGQKQFQQVRLRQDISVKSNKSPNRYNVAQVPQNLAHIQQQTIQNNFNRDPSLYAGAQTESTSHSLVLQNRNRNLIENSLNRPFIKPIDQQSVGLSQKFINNVNKQQSNNEKRENLQSIDMNPMLELEEQKQKDDQMLGRNARDISNSQRSFRIKKSVLRSISRQSNQSNLTNNDMNQSGILKIHDEAQKTIEHPTDVEDNHEQSCNFDHLQNSPDIKMKSIEIDNEISLNKIQNKLKKIQVLEGHEYISEADDNSGTGHRVNSNQKNETLLKLNVALSQRDKALSFLSDMKQSFLKFKEQHQKISLNTHSEKRMPSNQSERSSHSVISIRSQQSNQSQRFVKLKKVNLNQIAQNSQSAVNLQTDASFQVEKSQNKDKIIEQLKQQNDWKDEQIFKLQEKIKQMETLLNLKN